MLNKRSVCSVWGNLEYNVWPLCIMTREGLFLILILSYTCGRFLIFNICLDDSWSQPVSQLYQAVGDPSCKPLTLRTSYMYTCILVIDTTCILHKMMQQAASQASPTNIQIDMMHFNLIWWYRYRYRYRSFQAPSLQRKFCWHSGCSSSHSSLRDI